MSEEDINETLNDIDEMVREQYVCSVASYDEALDDYEIVWMNSTGRECGFFGSKALINRMFQETLLN